MKLGKAPKAVVIEMGARIIKRSPVGHPDFLPPAFKHRSGAFRANWRYGSNLERAQYDPSAGSGEPFGVAPAGEMAALTAAVGRWQMGTSFSIINPSPYGPMLEFGGYPNPPQKGSYNYRTKTWEVLSIGGYSRQAPKGMVRVTIGEFSRLASAAVKAERAKGVRV